jgi:hypothetical protein
LNDRTAQCVQDDCEVGEKPRNSVLGKLQQTKFSKAEKNQGAEGGSFGELEKGGMEKRGPTDCGKNKPGWKLPQLVKTKGRQGANEVLHSHYVLP